MIDKLLKFWKRQPTNGTQKHPVRVEALIVEDKKDESDLLAGLLRHQSVIVTCTTSITTALDALSQPTYYQLAFVDLSLPDGSGIEVVRRIKESRRMCHVVVVSGTIEKIPLVMGYGYLGLLGKPYTINSISEIIWKHRLPGAQ